MVRVIVRARDNHLLLVTQPDHAVLAETIMGAWKADALTRAPHRAIVLYAIRRHDDGWIEEDRQPLIDEKSGRVLDFMDVPDEVRYRLWPRGVASVSAFPYAAALVAQHAIHLHERHRTSPSWQEFFVKMEQARDQHLAGSAPLDAGNLQRDYVFLRMGDLMSLIFCNGWRERHHQETYDARFDGVRLRIDPDPFGGREVPLAVPARQLPNRRFHDRRDLSAAFAAAPIVTLRGVASGS